MELKKKNPSPVYLIGSERSGTNLLRKLITQHQIEYFGPPPAHFLKHLYLTEPYYQTERKVTELGFRNMVQDAMNLCYVHWSAWDIEFNIEEVIAEYSKIYNNYNSIYLSHYMMIKYARSKGFESYFCKDNHIYDYIFEILYFLPGAKFVYLFRDPRDFALSQKKRTLQTDSIRKIAKLWRDEQQKCLSASLHLREDQIIFIKYEDLIESPETKIREVCDFLDVDYHAESNDVAIMNGSIVTKEWENLSKPVLKENSKKYLKFLSSREIHQIESITSKQMSCLGYGEPDIKSSSFLYKIFDEVGLNFWSIVRRKYFPDKRDEWMRARAEMTALIAKRRLG